LNDAELQYLFETILVYGIQKSQFSYAKYIDKNVLIKEKLIGNEE